MSTCERAGRGGEFTLPGAEPHYPPDLLLEPVHLAMDLRVDVPTRRLEGSVTHTIRSRSVRAHRLRLDAVSFADVAVRDLDEHALSWRYDGRTIEVDWAEDVPEGEERRLEIRYRVEDPTTGLFFGRPGAAAQGDLGWAATDHETERARYWLPTVDLPHVRPTLDVRLRADARFTILGPGRLVGEKAHDDGTKTAHWRLEQPCPSYLTCFALGDFVRFDDGAFEGRPVAYFTSRAFSSADLQRSFGRTKEILAWMTKRLGHPFPFPKYYQFALPAFGGAMENVSLVSWDDQFVLDERLAREWKPLVDVINVHEMAHSYFGDMVVCRDYAHAWLKESWATYTESLWLEDVHGEDEALYHRWAGFLAYRTEADEGYRRPIVTRTFNHSWQMYDRHLYPGGAARLHLLRTELGDEAFFRGVSRYLDEHAFGTVETDDFRRAMEAASGRSLVRFFDQWLLGKGYPKVKAGYAYDPRRGEATITLEQTQVDEKEGVGLFDLRFDVQVVVAGTAHAREVRLSRAKQVVVIPVPGAPEQVRVDPDARVPMALELAPGDDLLRRQLASAPDVVGRVLAAQELCRSGKRPNVEAVGRAYASEPFWGVREQMAEALAKTETGAAVVALARAVETEQDPRVLERLFAHAGRMRAPEIREALEARLDGGLDLYRARGAAYEALGRQRGDAPLARLLESARVPDRYGFEQSGAFRALAATRSEDALDTLLAAAVPGGSPDRARPFAALAAGQLARYLPRAARARVADVLVERLRDPVVRVRHAAVQGLKALGERSVLPALEAFASSESDQVRVMVERAIQGLRGDQEPRAPETEKRLDELQTRLRRLEDTVERLRALSENDPGLPA